MASQVLSVVEGVFAMSQMISLTKYTFLTYILPPLLCLYLMGVLVQLEGMRMYRLALLPVVVCLGWRATFVDMSGGDVTKAQLNITLITQMCCVVTRCIVWAFTQVQYQRQRPEDNQNKSGSVSIYTACWNTWDLLLSPRGIQWNWSRRLITPKPTFETNSRVVFVLSTIVTMVLNAVAFDACVQTNRVLSPEAFGSVQGGSLFDHTLPPILELLRAILVSFLTAASIYFGIQHIYQLLAVICVTLFRQHPSQWPPIFDVPLLSTSLSELWGRRWHQLMRDTALNLGYRPLGHLFGPLGGLIGAFLVSGIFHNLDLGQRGYSFVCLGFWLMNGIGVVLERLWQKTTGRAVNGVWGWMWTAGWMFLWGIPMVDVYAKVGRLGTMSLPGGLQPSLALVALVRRIFDVANS